MTNYSDLYYKSKDKIVGYRLAMMDYLQSSNVKATSKKFNTTRKTVRKWKYRFDGTLDSLEDHSKRPHNIQTKVSDDVIDKIDDFCKSQTASEKRIVGKYMIDDLELPYSLPTINRYIKSLGYNQKKISRKERKRNLYELKKTMRAFEKIQVDIKHLDDMPEFYAEYYRLNLPRYQITARCVKTGSLFIGYAKEKTNLNTSIFIYRLLIHLQENGIDITQITIQTDNGREFRNLDNQKSTMFLNILKYFETKYYHIPAGAKTWQSDVETSHRLIEDEFYTYQIFNTRKEFFTKAEKYQNKFNLRRKNSYKENQTPAEILLNDIIHGKISLTDEDLLYIEDLYNFRPVIMDELTHKFLDIFRKIVDAETA
jgi:transposase